MTDIREFTVLFIFPDGNQTHHRMKADRDNPLPALLDYCGSYRSERYIGCEVRMACIGSTDWYRYELSTGGLTGKGGRI